MKTIIKRIIAIVCVAAFFCGIWEALRYLVRDDETSYTRIMMHEYYQQDNIDVLFAGASLTYRDFNTIILDEKLGLNTFNIGSGSQELRTTYYLLKDAMKRNDITRICLELSPQIAMDLNRLTATIYLITDYMPLSAEKVSLLLDATSPDEYVNGFLLARRYWARLFNRVYLGQLLKIKGTSSYRSYDPSFLNAERQQYVGKGHLTTSFQVSPSSFFDEYKLRRLSIEEINDDWYKYLHKIIDMCAQNGVELTLMCAPLSVYSLVLVSDDYGEYHDIIDSIAKDAGIQFWDFNLCRKEYFPCEDESIYYDSAHLNVYGAELLSNLTAELLNNNIDIRDICYDDFQQKFDSLEPKVCGLVYDGEQKWIVANHGELYEYRINVVPTQGDAYLIQDFDANNHFEIKQGEAGVIYITAREVLNPEKTIDIQFNYE